MVAVEQYNSDVRPSPLAGVLRFLSFDLVGPIVWTFRFVLGRTDADLQRRRIRLAERISEQAAVPTSQPCAEPSRIHNIMMAEYLQPCAVECLEHAGNATGTTQEIESRLDRVDYELAAIRNEIAPYLP